MTALHDMRRALKTLGWGDTPGLDAEIIAASRGSGGHMETINGFVIVASLHTPAGGGTIPGRFIVVERPGVDHIAAFQGFRDGKWDDSWSCGHYGLTLAEGFAYLASKLPAAQRLAAVTR